MRSFVVLLKKSLTTQEKRQTLDSFHKNPSAAGFSGDLFFKWKTCVEAYYAPNDRFNI